MPPAKMPTQERSEELWGALRPSESAHRRAHPLDGLWRFVPDARDEGEAKGFASGLPGDSNQVAVPGSWNEQRPELDSFLGPAWYQRSFREPIGFDPVAQSCVLRFGSVNYACAVFINGTMAGEHEGAHLPFEIDATPHLQRGGPNRLVLRVDGRLRRTHVPPGGGWGALAPGCFPSTTFDFYPYCGVQRSVLLCTRPARGLTALRFLVDGLEGARELPCGQGHAADNACVRVGVKVGGRDCNLRGGASRAGRIRSVRVTLLDARGEAELARGEAALDPADEASVALRVPSPALWAPGSPTLHLLRLEALEALAPPPAAAAEPAAAEPAEPAEPASEAVDTYEQPVGLRTVRVEGDQFLLNGFPVTLVGFGRHEDFPVVGRGECGAVLVRDHLMSYMHMHMYMYMYM